MSQDTKTALARLLEFLNQLQQRRIHYRLEHHRDEAIMVVLDVPGQRWEVEFFDDGQIEVERFLSGGDIRGEEALEELFREFGD